jgi:hypothetical protein
MPRKKWAEIKAKASPETIARAAAKTEWLLTSLRLDELRQARGLTPEALAEQLEICEESASMLEPRSYYISALRFVIEAMGGEMEIRARFPDAEYRLDLTAEDAQVEQVPSAGDSVLAGTQSGRAGGAGGVD